MISRVSTLSSSFFWLIFSVIKQTEVAQRTKWIGHLKCGCDTVNGRDWQRELEGRIGNVQALSCGFSHRECETQGLHFCHGHIGGAHFVPKTRQCSKNSSVHQSWMLHFALCWRMKEMGLVGITMHTKTILWWTDQNLWRPKAIG